MENFGNNTHFDNDSAQWYVALGTRWVGPLTAADVYHRIQAQELSWAHYVWKPGANDWMRLCDEPTFKLLLPTQPTQKPEIRKAEAKATPPAPARRDEDSAWFLFYNDTQFGPFSSEEISRFLRAGKIHGRVHIWKDGMPDWVRLDNLEQFEGDVAHAKIAREARKAAAPPAPAAPQAPAPAEASVATASDKRKAPRRPLTAKILMANHKTLCVAVCRDISVGGMQVLTDRIPGEPGSRIRLNVSPAASAGSAIEPFVAEGVIVRVLDDGRGFSFRFDGLGDSSRKVIEEYIKSA